MSSTEAITLGIQHLQAGRLEQAEALFRQVVAAEPTHRDARYRLAVVWQMQGRLAEALDCFKRLLQSEPNSTAVRNSLAHTYHAQGNDYYSRNEVLHALECWQQAVRLKPDSAEFFNSLGAAHSSRRAWGQARQAFQQALALQPRYAGALANLGMVHLAERHLDHAVHCLRQSLSLQPDNAAVHNALGAALLGLGKVVEAGQCFRQALCYRPNFTDAMYNLAKVCSTQERWEEAAALLEKTLTLKTPEGWVLMTLAETYHLLGKLEQALQYYRRYLTLDAGNGRIHFLIEALSGTSTLTRVPAEIATLVWDGDAEQWDQTVQRLGYESPQLLKTALAAEPVPANLDILDLGCGTGLCGLSFRRWARSLTGIDLSPKMLAKVRARGTYDRLIHGDILTATGKFVERFDLVTASDVLLSLGDLQSLFQMVHRALRPGGRFAFTVDLHQGPENYRLTPWLVFGHSREYLRKLAAESSWQEVSVNDVVFPRQHGKKAAGLAVVLAKSLDMSKDESR